VRTSRDRTPRLPLLEPADNGTMLGSDKRVLVGHQSAKSRTRPLIILPEGQMEQSYFAVECAYCKCLIPLARYDSELHYGKLADSFFARHEAIGCGALGVYRFTDLRRYDLETVPNLKPNFSFANQILPFHSA
jgi:hypothetical protein